MPRGRPRKACPDFALKAAMKTFWDKGFEGTSMADLVEATGMAKPGLYATFGDKETFYKKTLEHYFNDMGGPLLEDLVTSSDPLPVSLRRFFNTIADGVIDKTSPKGCFVTNSVVECASQNKTLEDMSRKFDKKRQDAFLTLFKNAKVKGEVSKNVDDVALAEFFSGQALAIGVMGRGGASKATLRRFVDVAMTALPN